MNKEELIKVFSAYLPYNLEVEYLDFATGKDQMAFLTGVTGGEIETTYKRKKRGCVGDIISWKGHNNVFDLKVKPVLYDLSYLTKEIELKNEEGHIYPEKISIIDYLNIAKSDQYTYHPKLNCLRLNSYGNGYTQWNFDVNGQFELSYRIFRLLIINHFNVFNLPETEFINKATLTSN